VCPSKTQSLNSLIHKALPLSYDNGSIQNNDWDSHLQASLDAQSLWSLSENMDSFRINGSVDQIRGFRAPEGRGRGRAGRGKAGRKSGHNAVNQRCKEAV
jgi:hypothetical protein